MYVTDTGAVVEPASSLVSVINAVPAFDRDAVIDAIRADRTGRSTFPQFLTAVWSAGVTGYVVDLDQRTMTDRGTNDATYVESYPAVEI